MSPGPKPVKREHLEAEAMQWACFFYTLRDGQPGWRQLVRGGGWKRAKREPTPWGTRAFKLGPGEQMRWGKSGPYIRKIQPVNLIVPIPVTDTALELPEKVKIGEEWLFSKPTYPKREVWEQLKKARSVDQVKRAARRIGKLRLAFSSSTKWALNPAGALSTYAKGFLAAKELASYPRRPEKIRKRSDDKRVVFLAKIMAGLTLGLAPITARKRLSNWSWPKDWVSIGPKEPTQPEVGTQEGAVQ